MDIVVKKEKSKIKVLIDNKEIKYKNKYCFIIGNIYNLDEFKCDVTNITDKILYLYDLYKADLFNKLNGDYGLLIIDDDKIIAVRDKIGTHNFYYYKTNDTFILTTSLKYIVSEFNLTIDKSIIPAYLGNFYINAPNTIFKRVKKLESGTYLIFNTKLNIYKYFDLINLYKTSKKINSYKKSLESLNNDLINSIKNKTKGYDRVGVFLSSGIDSTLITSILKKIGKSINTYTIAFEEKERDESEGALKISNYFNTNHHEYKLDKKNAIDITNNLFKIYTEPFADPSMIPTLFLEKNVDDDIILTGDGADQMFAGSLIYNTISYPKKIYRFIKQYKYDEYNKYKKEVKLFYNKIPESYLNNYNLKILNNRKYLLYDMLTFLPNRLLYKVSTPKVYFKKNIVYPFIDDNVVKTSLKIKYRYKYYFGCKKYILKNILYKNLDKSLIDNTKKGFGIPLKKWLKEFYKEDIYKYSDENILNHQGIFDYKLIKNFLDKLEDNTIKLSECYVLFAYYMFQLWYKEYIKDLWKK